MPTFGSLFAGIGGMDLGLERAGWECRWQVEIDEFCRKVLSKHWPDVPKFGDIKQVAADQLEPVDLICGGFPCQTVSVAGKRKAQADERWLWPEFARIVRLLRPRFVLVENVPGLLAPVAVRDDEGGGVLGYAPAPIEEVLGDLAAVGYDAEWDCIPAAAVGAPHLRYRVWIVAHAQDCEPRRTESADAAALVGGPARASGRAVEGSPPKGIRVPGGVVSGRPAVLADAARGGRDGGRAITGGVGGSQGDERGWLLEPPRRGEDVADAHGRRREIIGQSEPSGIQSTSGSEPDGRSADGELLNSPKAVADSEGLRRESPSESALALGDGRSTPDAAGERGAGLDQRRADRDVADSEIFTVGPRLCPCGAGGQRRGRPCDVCGAQDPWAVEPDVGRVAHGVPARVDRLKGLGNAVVSHIPQWIGHRLMDQLDRDRS